MNSISLGWNCEPSMKSVNCGFRKTKNEGYLTCPFDAMCSNFDGIKLCMMEDFKYFCDPQFLKIILAPFSTGGIVKGESLLVNTRYNFIFNHESPGHANLYVRQNWSGGINHFINNGFKLFIERYSRRINNFRTYVSEPVIFFIASNRDTSEIHAAISAYTSSTFTIYRFISPTPQVIIDQHMQLVDPLYGIRFVVAQYNESVDWCATLPKVTIYSKGVLEGDNKLPNVGREGHTFYTHIVANYDRLDEYTAFVQANPFDHSPNILQDIANTPRSEFMFLTQHIRASNIDTCPHHANIPMRDVYKQIFLDNPPNFTFMFGPGGQFIVSKRRILKRPKDFYERVVRLLENDINPMEGFCIERYHSLIFE